MGRFYKTSSANPLDYMYRINAPLMERVIATNDKYITDNLDHLSKLNTAAEGFNYLVPDEQRAKEITEQYDKQITNVAKAIRENPAQWRQYTDAIRTLSSDLQSNYKTGEISKITGNYNSYKTVSDYIDKQLEQFGKDGKGISADRAQAYKNHFLKTFIEKDAKGTNYDPKTGKYNAISVFNPMSNIDIRKHLGDELDKIKADSKLYKKDAITGDEWYFNKRTEKWEGVTPDRILEIVTDRLTDPQLQNYMQQESKVGLMKGIYDDDGKMIAPYNYRGVDIAPQEKKTIDAIKSQIAKTKDNNIKQQLQSQLDIYEKGLRSRKVLDWNEQSSLSPVIRGLVNQYAYNKSEQFDELRNNSKGSTKYIQGQTNQRQANLFQHQKDMAKAKEDAANQRFKEKMEWEKYKWDNPHEKKTSTGTGTTPKKSDTSVITPPVESTVSRLNTNSFEDWTTTDPQTGQEVKVLSNAGLSADISRLKDEEKSASNRLNEIYSSMKSIIGNRKLTDLTPPELNQISILNVEKNQIKQNLPKIQSDLNARRKWYQGSVDAVLSNNPNAKKDAASGTVAADLTQDEVSLYKEFESDRAGEKMRQDIINLEKKFPKISDPTEGAHARATSGGTMIDSPQVKAAKDKLQNYLQVKKKVDERRDNFLAQIRYTPIDTDAIQLSKDDSKVISDMVFANLQGVKLFDNTGNKATKLGDLEGKGINWPWKDSDDYRMSFVDDKNNLLNYISRENVTTHIEQVGNTTKIGSGNALLKVRFSDPNGQIPETSFYLEVTPELQKQIGTKMSQSKNPEVQKIASSLLDDEGNEIRRQLINPSMQRVAGQSEGTDPVTTIVYIRNGASKIPLQVTRLSGSDGNTHLNITATTADGQQIPLPGTQSGVPGWFNGIDDFIEYVKTKKQQSTK